MPVKIRQKQTQKTEWVDYEYYAHNIINNDLYKTLIIKDIYELYNRKTGVEVWQTTIEKTRALDALSKHPDIFRIEYSDKNTSNQFLSGLGKDLHIRKYVFNAIVKTWKITLPISALLISAYLSSGNHFDNLLQWLKSLFYK